jgi:DNA-binding MarR family transcriptional regulator
MNNYFEAIYEIIKTGHWITDSISKELKQYDIYEPQYNVLRILKAANGRPISVNSILAHMVQRSSNVTRIVDKLTQKGLAERTLSSDDRRKMDIVITAEGIALLTKLDEKVQLFHQPMLHNLTAQEADTLKHLIKKLKG